MRTLDQEFTTNASRVELLRRDLRVLMRMARMLWRYMWKGGRIRRAYRAMETRGEIYWVDESQP